MSGTRKHRYDHELVQERLTEALPELIVDLDCEQRDPNDIVNALNEAGLYAVPKELLDEIGEGRG
jgi:hypothetical protein